MKKHNTAKRKEPGFIAIRGSGRFAHRFGGQSWAVSHTRPASRIAPAVIAVLDLRDPLLSALGVDNWDELPLCGHVNGDAIAFPHFYTIYALKRLVEVQTNKAVNTEAISDAELIPLPLSEVPLILRPMNDDELPGDELSYWRACDSFVGGSGFIRVLGPEVWLQDPIKAQCPCGKTMEYVASIGHEDLDSPVGMLNPRAFFIGEVGLYFFLCRACLRMCVDSQPT